MNRGETWRLNIAASARAALVAALGVCFPGVAPAAEPPDPAVLERLSLRAAESLLRHHNRDLRAAQRAADAAKAGVLIARARPNPNLTLQTSNINPQVGIGAGNLRDKAFDTQIRLDYLIERGNKRDLRIASATALQRASLEDLRDTFRTQLLALANAYYDLLLGDERVRITHETAELFARTVAAARRREAAGDIAASDVDRISVDALRARSDEQAAIADRRHAQFALATILGLEGYAERISPADHWPQPEGVVDQEDIDNLVELRSDVRAAKVRAEAAFHARELARSQRTHDVTVAVTYDHWPSNSSNLQGTGNSYGVSVSVPLFLGNRFDGDIAKAESDWGAATDVLEKTVAVARTELARTRFDLATALGRLTRYDQELMVAAKRVAEAQEFAYQRGAIGVLDLLDARRTLRTVQLDATSAHADYAKALSAWRQSRASDVEE